jgi:hypothetical protein
MFDNKKKILKSNYFIQDIISRQIIVTKQNQKSTHILLISRNSFKTHTNLNKIIAT